MTNITDLIIGKKIISISIFEHSFQVTLEDNIVFTIYHPIQLTKESDYKKLIGMKFKKITESENRITLIFDNIEFHVKKDWDFGPEIMTLNSSTHPFVVWNE